MSTDRMIRAGLIARATGMAADDPKVIAFPLDKARPPAPACLYCRWPYGKGHPFGCPIAPA